MLWFGLFGLSCVSIFEGNLMPNPFYTYSLNTYDPLPYFIDNIFKQAWVLCNGCWHGFWVRSWWLRVLWQAVTLCLVNRGVAVRRGRSSRYVSWRRQRDMRTRRSVLDSLSSQNRESSQGGSRSEAVMSSLVIQVFWHLECILLLK